MADGCSGQNKNTVMVSMLMHWFAQYAPPNIDEITLIFPVTGHSFIPPDRVFGWIEKKLKKKDVILNPNELLDIINESQIGEVIDVAQSVKVYDFKSAMNGVIKRPSSWPFQISKIKRVYF